MRRSIVALALFVAGAVVGCDDSKPTAGASAEPAKSGTASAQAKNAAPSASNASPAAAGAGQAAETAKAEAKPADAATSAAAEPAAAAPTTATKSDVVGSGNVLRYMPKECDEGRVYANVNALAEGDIGVALDGAMLNLLAEGGTKGGKKAEEASKILKDGGVELTKAIDEIAVCQNNAKTIVALMGDMSSAANPAETLAKAIESLSGKKVKQETAGEITWISLEKERGLFAVIGKTTILLGEDKALVESAAKGLEGAADFGDAKNHVVWAKIAGKKSLDLTVDQVGDNFALKAAAKLGAAQATKAKTEFEKILPEIDKQADQVPVLKPAVPVIKSAKLEAAGDLLNVTADIPKATLLELLNNLKNAKPEDLKNLRF